MTKKLTKKELYEIALSERLEIQKHTPNYVGNFSVIQTDGQPARYLSSACYGQFNGMKKSIAYVADDPMLIRKARKSNSFTEIEKEYVKWWVNKSFAAKAFKTKDVDDILANGVVVDCRWPASYVVIALIGLRYLSEYPELITRWHKFKQHINADAAIFLVHKFEQREDGWYPLNFERNHTWLTHFAGKEQFIRIIEHDFSQFDKLTAMSKNQYYAPLMNCFSAYSAAYYARQRAYDHTSSEGRYTGPNEIIYPAGVFKKVKTIFGREREQKIVYKESEMKTWLKKTVALNRILEENK